MIKRSPIMMLLLWVLSGVVVAQIASCPQLIEDALTAMGDNCGDLSRNSACYGYNQVQADFSVDVPEGFFSVPSDRASLTELASVRTSPLDTSIDRWGIAVLNLQANLPNTVPGQGVLMMLVGDAEVRNDVSPESANQIAEPISTVVLSDADLRTSPNASSDISESVAADSILLVDGFDPTRNWLRVVTESTILWVQRDQVARLAAMDNLPVIGGSNPSPMQAFYLSTGIGNPECQEAEPMIAVQSPENLKVDLTVNGVDIRVGSLVTFQNQTANTINLTVHRGSVTTVFGNTINAGQSAIGTFNPESEQDNTIVEWGDPQPASEEDQALGQRAQTGLNNVARNNGWTERDVEPQSEETPESGELIHIVVAGETVYGIARRYDASLPEIIRRNGLTPPYTVFIGQELVIPNPGSGFVGLPSNSSTGGGQDTPSDPQPTGCEGLRLTAPLNAAATEAAPYYWDGIPQATQYQVNIYDQATGMLMGSFRTAGAETTITISAGQVGVGGAMQWEVVALQNGEPICSTGLSQPITHAPPAPPESSGSGATKPPFSISWKCAGYYELKVSWENANPDDTINIKVTEDNGSTSSSDDSGASGSITFSGSGFTFVRARGETSSGERAVLEGSLTCY